jgi:hypothetical protein
MPAPVVLVLAPTALTSVHVVAPHVRDPGAAIQLAVLCGVLLPLLLAAVAAAGRDVRAGIAAGALLVAAGAPSGGATTACGKACLAAAAGGVAARLLHSRAEVLGLLTLAALADVFSVLRGPTSWAMSGAHPAAAVSLVELPALGDPRVTVIGLTDILLVSMLLALPEPLVVRRRATALTLTAALSLVFLAGSATGRFLPALPAIALAFVLANAGRAARTPGAHATAAAARPGG